MEIGESDFIDKAPLRSWLPREGIEAVFLALLALINLGDEVLVPDSGFVCYEPDILIDFRLDAEGVMSFITDRSRVIITNAPNNPTGSVLSYDDITKLAKLAVERDLIVIS